MNDLTSYEEEQVRSIKLWKAKEPGVVSQVVGTVFYPLTWLVDKVVPKAAIRGAIDLASSLGDWLADTGDIKRDGGVEKISDLKTKNLELSDKLANDVHNSAIALATGEGVGLGLGGFILMAIDVPTLITLAMSRVTTIPQVRGLQGQMIPQFQGQMIPQFWGQMIPQFQGQIIPHF